MHNLVEGFRYQAPARSWLSGHFVPAAPCVHHWSLTIHTNRGSRGVRARSLRMAQQSREKTIVVPEASQSDKDSNSAFTETAGGKDSKKEHLIILANGLFGSDEKPLATTVVSHTARLV